MFTLRGLIHGWSLATSLLLSVVLTGALSAASLPADNVPTGWHRVDVAHAPTARYTHGSAFDSRRNVTVLFGGDDTGWGRLNDTWEFDGTDWSKVSVSGQPPGRANIDQTLTYDSRRGLVVLFGGLGNSRLLGDTWEYDGSRWLPAVGGEDSPPARDSHAMVFDSRRGVTVLFGGYAGAPLDDTWEYDGAWQRVPTGASPSARLQHSMAFDEQAGVVVLYGGAGRNGRPLDDTWLYDGTNWRLATPMSTPLGRHNHSLAFDSSRRRVVMFGGERHMRLLD